MRALHGAIVMSPEYLRELADLADPDRLWALSGCDQQKLSSEQIMQLDTGVALRRYAAHVERLRGLLGTGQSLLITPLSLLGTAYKRVPMPADHRKTFEARNARTPQAH